MKEQEKPIQYIEFKMNGELMQLSRTIRSINKKLLSGDFHRYDDGVIMIEITDRYQINCMSKVCEAFNSFGWDAKFESAYSETGAHPCKALLLKEREQ